MLKQVEDTLTPTGSRPGTGAASAPTRELIGELYAELRALAGRYFGTQASRHTLQPTALVHEAIVKLMREDRPGRWESRGHVLAVAARAMRQVLVDHARAKGTCKRGGGAGMEIDAAGMAGAEPRVDVLALNEAIEVLSGVDPRAARVVELRFFAGLTIAQAALVLDVSDYTVEEDWRVARAWLAQQLSPESEPAGASP